MTKYLFLSISCAFFSLFVTSTEATSLDQSSGIFKSDKEFVRPLITARGAYQHHREEIQKVSPRSDTLVPVRFQTARTLEKDEPDTQKREVYDQLVGNNEDEKVETESIAFTESLKVKILQDGTWQLDPVLLRGGILANSQDGRVLNLRVVIEPDSTGKNTVKLTWKPSNRMLGNIVISGGSLSTMKSGADVECLKSFKLSNFTQFYIEQAVFEVRVVARDGWDESVMVSASRVPESDVISIDIPPFVSPSSCTDLKFLIEVKQCSLRNGMSCATAVLLPSTYSN